MPQISSFFHFFQKTLPFGLTQASEHVIILLHTQTEFGERNE